MRFLSNLFSRTTSLNSEPQVSNVPPDQLTAAVELLLIGPSQRPNHGEVLTFMQSLKSRGIDLSRLRVITRRGRITYSVLPSLLPGRTLMLVSGMPTDGLAQVDAATLIREVVNDYSTTDLSLMQVLLDPQDAITPRLYADCGFRRLAELVYLECPTKDATPVFPADVTVESYSPAIHELFAAAIQASYEQTLDCPALNGVRSIEDVIAGHRTAGEYNPQHWFLLRVGEKPAGVLILAKIPGCEVMELVYVGLRVSARGRGLSAMLMNLALTRAYNASCRTLTTAVDAQNTPAMKMYLRAGMRRIGSRTAMVRVIHRASDPPSTIHQHSGQ